MRKALGDAKHPLHYLAIPPSMFATVAGALRESGCADGASVVVEKPFGRDLAVGDGAQRRAARSFAERAVFRIDHYLGKEAVQNLLYFRFANSFLEPIWNRNYVDQRARSRWPRASASARAASFYEEVGAIRDVVQNHLLQVVAQLAMEPPVGRRRRLALRREGAGVQGDAHARRRATWCAASTAATATRPASPPTRTSRRTRRCVCTSTRGAGPACRSTYAPARCLDTTATEVLVTLKPPPHRIFPRRNARRTICASGSAPTASRLRSAQRRNVPARKCSAATSSCSSATRAPRSAALTSGSSAPRCTAIDALFAREDGVLEAWRIVDPLLADRSAPHLYEPASGGPVAAARLTAESGGWRKVHHG